MKNQQSGFTLIELVVVIVILGILAATALPKFVDLTGDARKAALSGIVGGANSAATLSKGAWIAKGATGTTVDMDGTAVDVTSTAPKGYPKATATGIAAAMKDVGGATMSYAAGVATFTLQANCTATYTEATGTAAIGVDTGC